MDLIVAILINKKSCRAEGSHRGAAEELNGIVRGGGSGRLGGSSSIEGDLRLSGTSGDEGDLGLGGPESPLY